MRNLASSIQLREAVTTPGYVVGNLRSMAARKTTRGVQAASYRKNFIREWRLGRNLSQEKLGEMVGLTKATISRIEAGKLAYTRESLEAVAHALGTHPGILLMRGPTKAELASHTEKIA